MPRVSDALTASEKLLLACHLSDAAIEMKRAQLRRQHPDISGKRIDELLEAWLRERPGAEHGDGIGRPVEWPRR